MGRSAETERKTYLSSKRILVGLGIRVDWSSLSTNHKLASQTSSNTDVSTAGLQSLSGQTFIIGRKNQHEYQEPTESLFEGIFLHVTEVVNEEMEPLYFCRPSTK